MSDLDRLNYNITVAKAQQDARHAAEEGRDLAREQCVEAMAQAIKPEWFGGSCCKFALYSHVCHAADYFRRRASWYSFLYFVLTVTAIKS